MAARAMVMAARVAGSNGNRDIDCNGKGNRGGGRAMAIATKRAMTIGNKDGGQGGVGGGSITKVLVCVGRGHGGCSSS
jgi:hypothetical protein